MPTARLDPLRTLGRSGLFVSPLALGTMTFGAGRWGADEPTSRAILSAFVEAGGDLIDTADVYGGGASEEIIGGWLRDTGLRDHVVLSTKYGFNAGSSPLQAGAGSGANPHAGGSGALHLHRALDASLRRLDVDHIDLYWMHVWDGVTPAEELVSHLGDVVRSGKVRYYALSDMPAWYATKVATIAAARGLPGPVAIQVEYSLVAREVEREHVPAARDAGLGVVPWSPLAGGLLTGKYERDAPEQGGRLGGANPFGDSKFTARNFDVVDVVQEVADQLGTSAAQVALAWVAGRPDVATVLVGARTVDQLQSNIAANDVVLDPDQRRRLDEVSALAPGFTDTLTAPATRAMLFGGRRVQGWDEDGA